MLSALRVIKPGRLVWLAITLYWALAGTADARAGCGGHVRWAAHAFNVDLLVIGVDPTPAGSGAAPIPGDLPRPCTGPSCSGRNEPPVATPSPDRPPPDRGLDLSRALPTEAPSGPTAVARLRRSYTPPPLTRPERPPRP